MSCSSCMGRSQLTCVLVKSEQSEESHNNLCFAQSFCRNKSSPIRTSHNNAFVAGFFLSLDIAICLFPQFLTSMLPFFCSFVKVAVTILQRDALFSTSSPQNRNSVHCALLFLQFGGDLKMVVELFRRKERIQRECLPAMFPEKPRRKDIVKT